MTVASPPAGAAEAAGGDVPRWSRSAGLPAAGAVAVVLAAAGLIAGRVDLALLAVPLVAAVGLSWGRRPAPALGGSARLELGTPRGAEVDYVLSIRPPPGVEAVVLRHRLLAGEASEVVVSASPDVTLGGTVPLLHSGPQELVRVEYRFLGADASSVGSPHEPLVAELIVAAAPAEVRALPLPWRLQGLTGTHVSARAGDGGDFRDVHRFVPGDRLRRIDWKATARHAGNAGELYVRRTSALADATVLLVLDSRDDVGEQVVEWSRNSAATKGVSSLDMAREAAGSLASAYIQAGDRVGFQDLSSTARMIPQGGGSRHLWRLLRTIETTAPSAMPFSRHRPPIAPPGALVYLLSSLLDDQAVRLALTWRGSGHRVVAVDVLPAARFARTNRYQRLAHRVLMMERHDRIDLLQARGVEVLRWQDDGTTLPRRVRLQLLSRPARQGGRPAAGR